MGLLHYLIFVDATSLVIMMLSRSVLSIMRDELVHASVSGAEFCRAGLHKQHYRHTDEDHDNAKLGDASLSGEHEDVDYAGRSDERLVAIVQEVVNHHGNYRGRLVDFRLHGGISRVGIQLIKPLYDDKDIHPAEQAEKDDQTSDDLSPEHDLLVKVKRVKSLDADTHAHVHNGNNDRNLHLHRVLNYENFIQVQIPGRVHTKGIHTGGRVVVLTCERSFWRINKVNVGENVARCSRGVRIINVAGTKPVVGDRKPLVIKQTNEASEKPAQEQHVSEHLHILHCPFLQVIMENDHDCAH